MREQNDAELLSAYLNQQSEDAFGLLVERHIVLVYSAAIRQVQNPQLAEEITQATFAILAQKAPGLTSRTTLAGWLCRTAHFVARNASKIELRRHYREQEAYMQSLINEPSPETWPQFAPLLDEAVAHLNETDRSAVILRFFERKSLNEVSDILGVAPDAAQKRVSRALEKLRNFFARRGVNSTTSAIAESISAHSLQAVPVGLTKTVTLIAIAKGATASVSTLTLIKGALKIMAWTQAKTAIVAGVIIVLAAGTTGIAVYQHQAAARANMNLWRRPRVTAAIIDTATSQVTIVPTKFPASAYGAMTSGDGKWVGHAMPMHDLVRIAYDWAPGRVVFPEGEPKDLYDFASTLPKGGEQALGEKIKQTFGYDIEEATTNMDVLVLRVNNPGAPGLKPHVPGTPINCRYDIRGGITSVGMPISMPPPHAYWGLARPLEIYFKSPIVDETGLTGLYDIKFRWKERYAADPNHDAMKEVMLKQLGLELVPAKRDIDVLVVTKVK